MFSCKFAAYFQNSFFQEHIWMAASRIEDFNVQPEEDKVSDSLNIYNLKNLVKLKDAMRTLTSLRA